MPKRLVVVVPLALVITVALFFMMQELIAQRGEPPDETPREEFKIGREIKESVPPEATSPKPPVDEPPQPAPIKDMPDVPPSGPPITGGPAPRPPLDPVGGGPLLPDGPARALVRLTPAYPTCGRGNGQAVVEFYVEADGRIRDVKVVSSTSHCFGRDAQRAALTWHYQPRIENGRPVRSHRQRVVLQYVMPN